jgi:hypothetical protein
MSTAFAQVQGLASNDEKAPLLGQPPTHTEAAQAVDKSDDAAVYFLKETQGSLERRSDSLVRLSFDNVALDLPVGITVRDFVDYCWERLELVVDELTTLDNRVMEPNHPLIASTPGFRFDQNLLFRCTVRHNVSAFAPALRAMFGTIPSPLQAPVKLQKHPTYERNRSFCVILWEHKHRSRSE